MATVGEQLRKAREEQNLNIYQVAEITKIPRAPNGCEEVPAMLSRLLEAHETILVDAHDAAAKIAELGDDGSNDLIVSEVIRSAFFAPNG